MNSSQRIASIDWLRGLVMIIMVLDHVRDYVHFSAQDPTSDPNVGSALYWTRWISHLCAPTFVFLTGLSAGLMLQRKSKWQIQSLLLTRGIWLIFLEITLITLAWKFNFSNSPGIILQVIWAIGCSMIALALLVFMPRSWVLVTGVLIIAGVNLLDGVFPEGGFREAHPLWILIHRQALVVINDIVIVGAYPVLSWVGIIACGYASSYLFEFDTKRRTHWLVALGSGAIVVFLVLRFLNGYGDPAPWQLRDGFAPTLMSFFNVEKYPPSLLYSLVTLGIALLLLAFAERIKIPLFKQTKTFGRVPFFFYVAHLYLAHALAIILGMLQGFPASAWLTSIMNKPEGYGYSLFVVYLYWLLLLLVLFPLCRRFDRLKSSRKSWWTSYL